MKFSDKHWLAVAFFVIMIIIVQIIVSSPAFGATFYDNETKEVECTRLYDEDYVSLALAYKEHRIDLVNFRDHYSAWYHFVNSTTGVDIWLTEEEGQEMLKYLERMFGWKTW